MLLNSIVEHVKAFTRWRGDRIYLKRLANVMIAESGETDDGFAFIRLEGGKILYGYKSDKVQRLIFKYFLPRSLRQKLHISTINLAVDIAKRYLEPESESQAISASKLIELGPGDVIVEGGAYIGLYAIHVAEKIGPSGKVIAIEAIKENYEILRRNVEANGISNILYVNRGIWNRMEDLKYFRSKKQAASYSESVLGANPVELVVKADTLDNILQDLSIEKVDVVRLQINGAELKGLKGMPMTLAQKPKLLVAVPYMVDGANMKKEVESFLQTKDFITEVRGESIYATSEKSTS